MKVDMRDSQHLWITLNITEGDCREVIIDKEKDVRICDGSHVVKVRFKNKKIQDVLIDDVFVRAHLHLNKKEL